MTFELNHSGSEEANTSHFNDTNTKVPLNASNFRLLFDHLEIEIHFWQLIKDKQGNITSWYLIDANYTALNSWNKSKKDIIGKPFEAIFQQDIPKSLKLPITSALKNGSPAKWIENFKPTGKHLSLTCVPLDDAFILTGKDITHSLYKELELKRNEELLERTERIAQQGSWKFDIPHKEWSYSKNWLKLFGFSKNPSTLELRETLHPEDAVIVQNAFNKAIQGKEKYDIKHRIIIKSGETRWVKVSADLTRSKDGVPLGLTGITRDITDEVLKQKDFEKNQRLLQQSEKMSHQGSWHWDIKKDEWTFSENWYHINIGTKKPNMTKENLMSLVYADDIPKIEQAFKKALEDGAPYDIEHRFIKKDCGEVRWAKGYGEVSFSDSGEPLYMMGVGKDITEEKMAQQALKESEEFLTKTGEIARVGGWYINQGSDTIEMTKITRDIYELPKNKILSVDEAIEFYHPEDQKLVKRCVKEAIEHGKPYDFEARLITAKNNEIWAQALGEPEFEDGIFKRLSGTFQDITKRKHTEEALLKSQQRFLNITESLPGIVAQYKLNTDGTDELLYISKGVESLYEISAEEAQKDNQILWNRVHQEDLERLKASIKASAEKLSIWQIEHRIHLPDDRIKWVYMSGVPNKQEDGSVIWDNFGLDITRRKEAEFKLSELNTHLEKRVEERTEEILKVSEELKLYQEAAHYAKSGVWFLCLEKNELHWDDIMYNLYGIDEADFSGAYEAWETSLHPDDKVRTTAELNEAIEGINPFDTVFRIVHPKTGRISHIRAKGKIKRNDEGKATCIYGTNWDVTQEMELAIEKENALHELKAAQSQLIHSEKMASLGVLTTGIAHEINNPLNYVLGGYKALKESFDNSDSLDKEELTNYLEWIKTGAEKATNIVKSLNHFNRKSEGQQERCNLHKIINDCVLLLQNEHKDRINISKNYNSEPLFVLGDNSQLHQAVLNLLSNAVDAISNTGQLTIQTKTFADIINLTITDTGCGISETDLGKIRDPFFTTKPPGVNTGLGLSITESIIKNHNGKLNFKSVPNEGTTVTVTLPNT